MRGLEVDSEDWSANGIQLEQLDDEGTEWFGTGPSGEQIGSLAAVLAATAEPDAEPEWLRTVARVVAADSACHRRSGLIARRAQGVWYHATSAENRASIVANGLDWARFPGSGIAGSQAAEAAGVFLCPDEEGTAFFVRMGRQRGHEIDVWAATLDGQWLVSDPGASGGLDDNWMICLAPIPSEALTLVTANRPQ